jgi:HEAT repeat protein
MKKTLFVLASVVAGLWLVHAAGFTGFGFESYEARLTAHMRELDARIAKDHSEYAKLDDKDRAAVVVWWGEVNDDTAQWGLVKAATDSDPKIRRSAIFNLSRRCNARHNADLVALLGDAKSDTGALIKAIGACKVKDAAPALMRLLNGRGEILATTALGQIGATDAIPQLKTVMASTNSWASINAAEALANLGDRSGYKIAAKWLSDSAASQGDKGNPPEWMVQQVAARTLGKIGTRKDLPLLRAVVERGNGILSQAASSAVMDIMDREGMKLSDWKSNSVSRRIVLDSFPQDIYGWNPALQIDPGALASRNQVVAKIERVAGASRVDIFRYCMRNSSGQSGGRWAQRSAIWEVVGALDHKESRQLLNELLSDPDPSVVGDAKNRLQVLDQWERRAHEHAALWK